MYLQTHKPNNAPQDLWSSVPDDFERRLERYALRLLRRQYKYMSDDLAEIVLDNMHVIVGETLEEYLQGIAQELLNDFESWVKSHTRFTSNGVEYRADRYSNDYWAIRENQWETIKAHFNVDAYIESTRYHGGLFYEFRLFADYPVVVVLPLWDELRHRLEVKQQKKEDNNDTNHTDS
jgi:hypothetical protein